MAYEIPAVGLLPLPDAQVSFQAGNTELLRYHHAPHYPRPFFFPLHGPSGKSLTRMGHPAAPDHDHHRSVWFGHHDIAGNNFWAEGQATHVKQRRWLVYQDGPKEAMMAVEIDWFDSHHTRLLTQELLAAVQPLAHGEWLLELQSTFSTTLPVVRCNKTNFGFLAVRVAKSISRHYGGGELRADNGKTGEPALFGKEALWVDYSGPVLPGVVEGITVLPHPQNPHYPCHWHVRDDGWMSPAFNLARSYDLKSGTPLQLRYRLHIHGSPVDPARAAQQLADFAKLAPLVVQPAAAPLRAIIVRAT